ncbi:unnamed protein product [Acanthoscelides obtectus]|uniref:Uncharacterized protein n=1 Tax=Acanthoscelides obtectus TaxID=200917 RepID=A0A9P0NXK1_ACAOB|nr:unnamed protein product [Acanthoscelides obtectus]CAK1638098.1 hypothetical protein AOBTE_LOCUS10387 [Acanthoscelides obtectus]
MRALRFVAGFGSRCCYISGAIMCCAKTDKA